jgi:hypothetical protein
VNSSPLHRHGRRVRHTCGGGARNSCNTPSHNRSGSRSPALARSNDLPSQHVVGEVAAISKPECDQGHFKCKAHDPDRFRVELLAVEVEPDGHGVPEEGLARGTELMGHPRYHVGTLADPWRVQFTALPPGSATGWTGVPNLGAA